MGLLIEQREKQARSEGGVWSANKDPLGLARAEEGAFCDATRANQSTLDCKDDDDADQTHPNRPGLLESIDWRSETQDEGE